METTQEKFTKILNQYMYADQLKSLLANLHKSLNERPKPWRIFDVNNKTNGYGTIAEAKLVSGGPIYPGEYLRASELPEGGLVVTKDQLELAWGKCEKHVYSICYAPVENITFQNFLKELGI